MKLSKKLKAGRDARIKDFETIPSGDRGGYRKPGSMNSRKRRGAGGGGRKRRR